jgi:hypothetical protein
VKLGTKLKKNKSFMVVWSEINRWPNYKRHSNLELAIEFDRDKIA